MGIFSFFYYFYQIYKVHRDGTSVSIAGTMLVVHTRVQMLDSNALINRSKDAKLYLQPFNVCVNLLNPIGKYKILSCTLICMPCWQHTQETVSGFCRHNVPQVLYLQQKMHREEKIRTT